MIWKYLAHTKPNERALWEFKKQDFMTEDRDACSVYMMDPKEDIGAQVSKVCSSDFIV